MPWAQRLSLNVFRLKSKSFGSVANCNLAALVPAPQRAPSTAERSLRRPRQWAREQACSNSSAQASVEESASSALSGSAALDLTLTSSSAMTDDANITVLSNSDNAAQAAYRVVNFYHLVNITNPHQVCSYHGAFSPSMHTCIEVHHAEACA